MSRAVGAAMLGCAASLGLMAPLPLQGAEAEARPFGVVDLHVDLSFQVSYRSQDFAAGTGQFPQAALAAAGVVGVVLPLYVPKRVSPTGPRASDLEQSYVTIYGHLTRAASYQLPGCGPEGRVRTWLAFEGAAPLAENPSRVREWVARGVRVFGLVHAYDNALATSATGDAGGRTGLTEAGRAVVRAVHENGAVVDVSHASDRAAKEVVAMAREAGAPVVATHSNARVLADHPRNLPDDLLRAIADTGGVVGVNFHSPFLARDRDATLEDVVRHVRHVGRVAGMHGVAIGSDFEGDIRPPPELRDASRFPVLAQALLDAGSSRREVTDVFGRNALRVLCGAARRGSAARDAPPQRASGEGVAPGSAR